MKRLIIVLFILLLAPSLWAQPRETTLQVATRLVKPFVFEEGGRLTGFSIELWQEISRLMNARSTFLVKPTVQALIRSVETNEANLAIAAISITAERDAELDFSQPMFDAGLQILIPASGSEGSMMAGIVAAVFNSSFLPMLGFVLLTVILTGHLVWFFERRRPNGMLSSSSYFPGIFEACWWSASTLATQADQMPRSAVARVVAVFWMFTAVVFIAYFTAAVTSSLTIQQLRGEIKGPEDLPGKRIAAVTGSTSADYLKRHNIAAREFLKVEDAYAALQQSVVDAVVYDAPVLLYYAAHGGKGRVQVVGPIFHKESYGILFPPNSPERKRVNEALLRLKENGTYERIYAKWFGGEGS